MKTKTPSTLRSPSGVISEQPNSLSPVENSALRTFLTVPNQASSLDEVGSK